MPTPINLNKVRKSKQREEKERQATENRVKFGRTKVERRAEFARKVKAETALNNKKLDT